MNSYKKVLLTGATGLIGKEAIKPLLDDGFEVYALSSKVHESQKKICWIQADLFDNDAIEKVFEQIKPQYLLHFAWCASGDYLTSEDNSKYLDSSLKMLEAFKKNGGERAVMAGTCFEYKFKDTPLKEDDELNPQTLYAKCKNELREKAEIFCTQTDISFAWGRIFYVYGYGENVNRLTPHVANLLREGKEAKITAGPLVRDYMFTKDIALAFVTLLSTNVSGCVNICTNNPISIKDYVEKIASKLGKSDLLDFDDKIEGQPKFIVGDNSRLINEVGYEIRYSINDALNEILDG